MLGLQVGKNGNAPITALGQSLWDFGLIIESDGQLGKKNGRTTGQYVIHATLSGFERTDHSKKLLEWIPYLALVPGDRLEVVVIDGVQCQEPVRISKGLPAPPTDHGFQTLSSGSSHVCLGVSLGGIPVGVLGSPFCTGFSAGIGLFSGASAAKNELVLSCSSCSAQQDLEYLINDQCLHIGSCITFEVFEQP